MKKFEEELEQLKYHINTNWSGDNGEQLLKESEVIEHFKDWVSPEGHQAEIDKTELQNLKYREEIARMQKALRKKNKAIKELNVAVKKAKSRLKECEHLIEANNQAAMEYSRKCEAVEERAELKRENQRLRAENLAVKTLVENAKKENSEKQQPEIPEFVAELIEYARENNKTIRWCLYGNCQELYSQAAKWIGADDETEFTEKIWKQQESFVRAWINDYTVAKEKRFYLKHIDMSKKYNSNVCVLAHGEGDVIYGHCDFPVGVFPSDNEFKFTQQEIDSMETGSYEQIEVGE